MFLLIGLAIGAVLDWLFLGWLCLVPVMWPSVLYHVLFVVIIALVVSAIADKVRGKTYNFDPTVWTIGAGILTVVVILIMGGVAIFAGPINNGKLRDLGRIELVNERLEVADTNHIRVNPKESAVFLGNQVIGKGNLGSRFKVGEYDVQRNNNKIVWLAPLDFQGFFAWQNAEYSPGYVAVSAEDGNAAPKLVDGFKMKYMTSAYFGDNLQRHLYFNGYAAYDQEEVTFEADDNGKPFYVVSMTQPSVGYTGDVLKKVVIVDPQTGEIKAYEPGKTPAWVDRAFPESLSKQYAYYWGEYVHGFWNWSGRDKMKVSNAPAEENVDVQDVFLVHNKQTSNSNWICGMTSQSNNDKALTGYMSMDSITGKMKFYQIDSIGNEAAVINAVASAPEVAVQKSYRAAQPILYNIYGEDSWVVPVLSSANIPEKVAIVYGKDVRHTAIGNNRAEALEKYKTMLAELRVGGVVPTDVKETKSISGTVSRISVADSSGRRQLLLVEHPNQLFEVTRLVSAEVLVTNVGDKVKLSYLDTTEEVVSVKSFDNLGLTLTPSVPQQQLEAQEAKEASASVEALKKQQQEIQKQVDAVQKQIKDTQQ